MSSTVWKTLERIARSSELIGPSRHSAALVHKGTIICTGHSQTKTHPLQKKYGGENKQFLHAEVSCLSKAIRIVPPSVVKQSDLYVLRITRGGFIGQSKPCPICQELINDLGLKKVHWTNNKTHKSEHKRIKCQEVEEKYARRNSLFMNGLEESAFGATNR